MKTTIEGRELDLNPIEEGGLDVTMAITLLRSGQPVGWTIEPGDMTRYRVLLVPCWSNTHIRVVSALGYDSVNSFILLTYVSDTMPFSRAVGQWCGPWDLLDYGITNQWTAMVLSSLIRGIWDCLLDSSIDPNEHEVKQRETPTDAGEEEDTTT